VGDVILAGELGLGALLSSTAGPLAVRSGFFYRLGAIGQIIWDGRPVTATLFYQDRRQNTSLTDARQSELGLLLSIELNLGGGA
jgi:hypothetical protein